MTFALGVAAVIGCGAPAQQGAAKVVAEAGGSGAGAAGLVDVPKQAVGDDLPAWQETRIRTSATGTVDGIGLASGELTLLQTASGAERAEVERCRTELRFDTEAFTGDCAACDFAFSIDASVVTNEGDCVWAPSLSLLPPSWGGALDPVLGWWSTYTTPTYSYTLPDGTVYTWGGIAYVDALRLGWSYIIPEYEGPEGTVPESVWGPVWRTLVSGSSGAYGMYGTWSVVAGDEQLQWSVISDQTTTEAAPRDMPCVSGLVAVEAVTGWIGPGAVDGTLPCTADGGGGFRGTGAMDRWAVNVAAGDTLVVTADTIALDTTFDPVVWVDGPAGCTLAYGDDELECSAPPPAFGCPAIRFTAPESGVYEVVVSAQGSCAGAVGAYRLDVVSQR